MSCCVSSLCCFYLTLKYCLLVHGWPLHSPICKPTSTNVKIFLSHTMRSAEIKPCPACPRLWCWPWYHWPLDIKPRRTLLLHMLSLRSPILLSLPARLPCPCPLWGSNYFPKSLPRNSGVRGEVTIEIESMIGVRAQLVKDRWTFCTDHQQRREESLLFFPIIGLPGWGGFPSGWDDRTRSFEHRTIWMM